MKQYMEEMITEKTLEGMLKSLTELYVSEQSYPIKIQGFFDVPNFAFSNVIENKDELKGRIKVLAQLLGKETITISSGSAILEVKL